MTKDQFAARVLQGIGAKVTPGAMAAMRGWINQEGGHTNGARFNYLNTTQDAPGAGNTGTQGNIKVYTSWDQGVKATIQTLQNGHYNNIINALRQGDGNGAVNAINSSVWGTHGVKLAGGGNLPSDLGSDTAASQPSSHMTLGSPGKVSLPGQVPSARVAVGMANLEASGASPVGGLPKLGKGPDINMRAAQLFASGQATEPTSSALTGVKAPRLVQDGGNQGAGDVSVPSALSQGGHTIYELIHNTGGGGGYAVKNGKVVSGPQVFASVWEGHKDHVHVAADPDTEAHLGKLAQRMGLRVGENVYFTGQQPAGGHVSDSYHYRVGRTKGGKKIDLGMDVSGDPRKMNAFAAEVQRLVH